ncbi:MAG: septum formation protein Maf [Proteobacteria bacterium]|nr:septum formation protein Maf [Pseudomonadota bacterium]
MRQLLLASTSAYRRALLTRLGCPFEVSAPGVDETHLPAELPVDRAARLALAKALAVAQKHPDAIVIGSDQVATDGAQVLDKPGNAARAREQLALLSGRHAGFHTACAVVQLSGGMRLVHIDTTTVVFRALDAAEIARYVQREQPLDCAGGFRVEALGISLFERIDSHDPTALIGLPLIWLAGALRQAGLPIP